MPRMNFSSRAVLGLLVFLSAGTLRVDAADEKGAETNAAWLAEHYTKYEHRISMRDGVRLFTRVYVPKDDAQTWRPAQAINYNFGIMVNKPLCFLTAVFLLSHPLFESGYVFLADNNLITDYRLQLQQ